MAHSVMFKVLCMGKEEAYLTYRESQEFILNTTEILALIESLLV